LIRDTARTRLKTGKRINSNLRCHGNCPAVLPNGIVAQSGNGTITLTQVITP